MYDPRTFRMLFIASVVIALISSCKEECIVNQTSYEWTTTVSGETRRAIIWKPRNECIQAPVLIYFHGRGGSAEDSEQRRGFHNLLKDMYVVYAEGTNFDDRPDGALGWETRFPHIDAECRKDKDLSYVLALFIHLAGVPNVNLERVGAAGHSSGGFFTLTLAEIMPESFLGFACLGSYSSYIASSNLIDCDNTYEDAFDPDLVAQLNDQVSYNPAPTLFMFGTQENTIKNNDIVYNEDCNVWSYFQNSIVQLSYKNGVDLNCANSDYMNTFSRQVFGQGKSELQLQMYNDDHSWPVEANQWAADYFADLLYF